jgi:hypothetical protein
MALRKMSNSIKEMSNVTKDVSNVQILLMTHRVKDPFAFTTGSVVEPLHMGAYDQMETGK